MQIASGQLYGSLYGRVEKRVFELASIFPPGFDFEPGSPTHIDICSLPVGLQDTLSSKRDRCEPPTTSDLWDFLSQGYVQSLYTSTLGPTGFRGDKKHPLWANIFKKIKATSTVSHPISKDEIDGLSLTIVEALAEFTVNVSNILSSDTFEKSVKACVGVLLKQYLDGPWEKQRRERRRAAQAHIHHGNDGDDDDDDDDDDSYTPSSGEDSGSNDEDGDQQPEEYDYDVDGRYPSKKLLWQPLRDKLRYRRELLDELATVLAKGGRSWDKRLINIENRLELVEIAISEHRNEPATARSSDDDGEDSDDNHEDDELNEKKGKCQKEIVDIRKQLSFLT